MGRFRYSGTNWEGRKWSVSPAVRQLGEQIETEHIKRHGADGTVASQGHDSRSPNSDHRPKPISSVFGTVRAIDFGDDDHADLVDITEGLRTSRDIRVKYCIFDERIFSSYEHSDGAPYTWRPYHGSNPHRTHSHVSLLQEHDGDTSLFDIGGDDLTLTPDEQDQLSTFLRVIENNGSSVYFVQGVIKTQRDGGLASGNDLKDLDVELPSEEEVTIVRN